MRICQLLINLIVYLKFQTILNYIKFHHLNAPSPILTPITFVHFPILKMDDLFSKYKELLIENEALTIELQKQKTQNTLAQEELALLRSATRSKPAGDGDADALLRDQEGLFKRFFLKNKKYVLGLLGYDMEVMDDRIELLSLYAFHDTEKFVFTIENNTLNLLSNDMTEAYKGQVQEFLAEGKSIPAFLAHVTMDLWNKKTFQ